MKFVASCTLCNWHQKCKGIWDIHWQTRNHFMAFHRKEYNKILEVENQAHDLLNTLRKDYGQAVSRRF